MRALLLPIGILSLVGLSIATACSVSITPSGPTTFAAYGVCDSATSYAIVTDDYVTYCGDGFVCDGDYYDLCGAVSGGGFGWDSCVCDLPAGYVTLVPDPDFGGGIGSGLGDDGGSPGDDGGSPDGSGMNDSGSDGGSSESGGNEAGSSESGGGDDSGSGGSDAGGGGSDS
jgi:hypothetical protein